MLRFTNAAARKHKKEYALLLHLYGKIKFRKRFFLLLLVHIRTVFYASAIVPVLKP